MLDNIQSFLYNFITSTRFWIIIVLIFIFLIASLYVYKKYVSGVINNTTVPNIEFENPNEEVAENLVLAERGKYLCNECGSTIAEYREFRKPDETMNVGLANPIEQQDTGLSSFDTPVQQDSTPSEIVQEPIPTGGEFRSIFGMDVFDESAKKIGKAKQVGVNGNQELVLVISDDEGNDVSISWSRIGTVGEVIFLGKSEKTDVKVEQTVAVGTGLRCTSCNFDNKPDSKFCESCGDKLA